MEQLRLLHTADLHLGQSSEVFGARATDHRALLRQALENVVRHCLDHEVDLLLVAGDLFDNARPAAGTAEFVWQQLQSLRDSSCDTQIVLLPGTHDHLCRGGVYDQWSSRLGSGPVHLLTEEQPLVSLWDDQVVVAGALGRHRLPPLPAAPFTIGLAHTSVRLGNLLDPSEPVWSREDIAATGVDYLALGHWHRFGDYSSGGVTALYSGSPELVAIDQVEQGEVIQAQLRPGGSVRYERVPLGKLRVVRRDLQVETLENSYQLAAALRRDAGPYVVLDATLRGLADPSLSYDPEELAQELTGDFFRVRLRDQSHLAQQEITATRYPPQLITGRFARLMEERLTAARDSGDDELVRRTTQALQLGLALLEGKEVLP